MGGAEGRPFRPTIALLMGIIALAACVMAAIRAYPELTLVVLSYVIWIGLFSFALLTKRRALDRAARPPELRGVSPLPLLVQKFGGTSVADSDKI
ncbi:MAG: hypothetical protein IRY99_27380, partial [Isosphaeraceae bacterium]|nr:hypothetical protein [Isosphaeraceae bacterium]